MGRGDDAWAVRGWHRCPEELRWSKALERFGGWRFACFDAAPGPGATVAGRVAACEPGAGIVLWVDVFDRGGGSSLAAALAERHEEAGLLGKNARAVLEWLAAEHWQACRGKLPLRDPLRVSALPGCWHEPKRHCCTVPELGARTG